MREIWLEDSVAYSKKNQEYFNGYNFSSMSSPKKFRRQHNLRKAIDKKYTYDEQIELDIIIITVFCNVGETIRNGSRSHYNTWSSVSPHPMYRASFKSSWTNVEVQQEVAKPISDGVK